MWACVFMIAISSTAQAAGYYTPPCLNEEQAKNHSLKSLDRCLEKGGQPPFREVDGSDSIVICPKELSEFKTAVKAYRSCLETKKAPPSSSKK